MKKWRKKQLRERETWVQDGKPGDIVVTLSTHTDDGREIFLYRTAMAPEWTHYPFTYEPAMPVVIVEQHSQQAYAIDGASFKVNVRPLGKIDEIYEAKV